VDEVTELLRDCERRIDMLSAEFDRDRAQDRREIDALAPRLAKAVMATLSKLDKSTLQKIP